MSLDITDRKTELSARPRPRYSIVVMQMGKKWILMYTEPTGWFRTFSGRYASAVDALEKLIDHLRQSEKTK